MSVTRRDFIRSTVTSGAALLVQGREAEAGAMITVPDSVALYFMATNWGFPGTIEQFCQKAKSEGYDGIEVGWPSDTNEQKRLLDAVKANQLKHAFLIGVWDQDGYDAHLKSFETKLRQAAAVKPLYLNCHAGKDHFTYDQNVAFINLTATVHKETQIPIYHETHRGRILYAAPIAKNYIDKLPNLRLTLDISHWCAVHESLLGDQAATVDLALSRTDHIHARVGHAEGPQVGDPRAPEWQSATEAHLKWWDTVVNAKVRGGAGMVTFLTEFGPPDYLPALPYTRQPVVNQWEVNVYMLNLLKKRYVRA